MKLIILMMFCSVVCFAQSEVPGDYPQASTRMLEDIDLEDLSEYDLSIMRNEIFARYGYIFKKAELREYFLREPWYKPKIADVNVVMTKLTDTEKQNISLIQFREAWLKPVPFRKLPRLSLPLNFGDAWSFSEFHLVSGISLDAQAIIGLLPDTTRYYAVLWYQHGLAIDSKTYPRMYFITTYTKKLKEISTARVSLPLGGLDQPGGTDCENRNYDGGSSIENDLSFKSICKWEAKCPEDTEFKEAKLEVSGRIKSDGTIVVIRNDW